MQNHYFTHIPQAKSDHEPGYIYLMEAEGYHGILPGCYLRRCKIGLSRNPQLRLQNCSEYVRNEKLAPDTHGMEVVLPVSALDRNPSLISITKRLFNG